MSTRVFGKCVFISDEGKRCNARIVVDTDAHPVGEVFEKEGFNVVVRGAGIVGGECVSRGHDSTVIFKSAKVTVVPTITCDHKCHDAVSEICKCSCGGANHGQLPSRRS